MGSNVYDDPYSISRPNRGTRMPTQYQQPQTAYKPLIYDKIQSVLGFDGAREFANTRLSPGASCIIAEANPEIARVYVVSKDENGVPSLGAYKLIPEEEPKPITMQDISAQLADIQNRITKLEENSHNDKSVCFDLEHGPRIALTESTAASPKQPTVSSSNGNDSE